MDKGKEIEEAVGNVAAKAFLADFVVPNPMYRKNNGDLKEVADVLVPFGSTLLVIQVKTKTESIPASQKEEKDFQRIEKRLDHAVQQLKTAHRALGSETRFEMVNRHGVSIPYSAEQFERKIGIVILALIGEEKFDYNDRTRIYGSLTELRDMPVHLFAREDFDIICDEYDTLPDFLGYMNLREALYKSESVSSFAEERDLLAVSKLNRDLLEACIRGECDFIHLDEGLWNQYITEYEDQRRARSTLNNPSYIVDDVILELHKAIGFDPGCYTHLPMDVDTVGTKQSYFSTIHYLSRLNRLDRRAVGERFLRCMEKAARTGDGHSLFYKQDSDEAVLVMSSRRDREERVTGLYNLCGSAFCTLKLKSIVGICSEPIDAKGRSFDVILQEDLEITNPEAMIEIFRIAFGDPIRYTGTEYSA